MLDLELVLELVLERVLVRELAPELAPESELELAPVVLVLAAVLVLELALGWVQVGLVQCLHGLATVTHRQLDSRVFGRCPAVLFGSWHFFGDSVRSEDVERDKIQHRPKND